jgi:ABC-type transport system involved in multi-copper enzyme maturation permease subunit
MLPALVRKEILENILSYRFPLFLVIVVILIPFSLYVNALQEGKNVADYREQIRLGDEALRSSRMIELHMGTIPFKGFRPPAPLSVFANGCESALPRYYEFGPGGAKEGKTSVGEESVLSVLGKFDYLFIIQMIVSLVVLLFASDLVAGEKEMGTLRGMLSNSVPRSSLLVAKLLGGFIAVWIPFVIAFLFGLVLLSLGAFRLSPEILRRIVIIFAATSFFLLTYFTMGLLVSASTSRSRSALVASLLLWIVLQLVFPRTSDMVASVVSPARTEAVVSLEKSMITRSLEEERGKLLGREYERIFGRGTPLAADLPPGPGRDQWVAIKADAEKRFRERAAEQIGQLEEAHQREKRAQGTIASALSLLSPGAAFTRLITDLCATGDLENEKFRTAVLRHQQTLERMLFSHVSKTTLIFPGGGTASSSSIDELVDLKTLPAFSIERATLADVLNNNWGSILSLVLWFAGMFAFAHARFLRYDVR